MKNLYLQVAIALGTLLATVSAGSGVQVLAAEANFEQGSTSFPGLVAQARIAEELLSQASELLGSGEYEEALTVFEQVLKLKRDSFSAWYWHGYILSHLERYEAAIASFDEAVKIKPNYVLALYAKANALYKLQRYEDAINVCDRALKLNSEHYQAWSLRGLALYRSHRTTEARASLEQATKINPDDLETTGFLTL
ncbi:MAG: tetratricopeptide repeat protein, partial [Coleofasciculus sp. S288]|nr:tetratricopeptide repeat protein [Coleofasciculus sp. S288]